MPHPAVRPRSIGFHHSPGVTRTSTGSLSPNLGLCEVSRRDQVKVDSWVFGCGATATSATSMEATLDDHAGHNLTQGSHARASRRLPRRLPLRLDVGLFTVVPANEPLPPGRRLVTPEEEHDHREELRRAIPGWEPAYPYIDFTSVPTNEPPLPPEYRLVTPQEELDAGPHFFLVPTNEPLPPGYRLVTLQEQHDHREELQRAMAGWEPAFPFIDFTSVPTNDPLPPQYRLVTLQEGYDHRREGYTRVRSIDYDSHDLASQNSNPTLMEDRLGDYAGHNLTTQNPTPRIIFTLVPTNEPLPPGYRLVTVDEVHDNLEEMRRAMPGGQIAKLADGFVDDEGCSRLDRRDDVGHKLVMQSPSPTYARRSYTPPWALRILLALIVVLVGILVVIVGILIVHLKAVYSYRL